MKRSAQEINEIERHKYFLSEKQGYDVGWDYAERDWELNHAAQFRRQHPLASVGECCSTTSAFPFQTRTCARRSEHTFSGS